MAYTGKILLMDDDRLVLATLSLGLTQAGYEVIDANNSDDAILLARAHRPDLALLEIRMAGQNDSAVATYLREYCRIPFLFLSALADDDSAARVKASGATGLLVKPIQIDQVLLAVEAALANIATRQLEIEHAAAPSIAEGAVSISVAMAVGILMHRYSLGRQQALEHLQRLADTRSVEDHANRLIDAVELLATSAPPRA